jgi:hypothetical protein
MMSESELVLSPSTVSESKLFCEHLSLFVVSELEIFKKERRIKRIIIRNGAKTISIPNFVWET